MSNIVYFVLQVTGETEDVDEESRWGADEEDDENTLFDMDEFVLQESTGYMLPTLRFLAIFHTIISLVCLVGYYCLKVQTFMILSLFQEIVFRDPRIISLEMVKL